jgi:hypothetical protein
MKSLEQVAHDTIDGETSDVGVDLSLIEHNLALSREDRIIEHERALSLFLELEQRGAELRKQGPDGQPR